MYIYRPISPGLITTTTLLLCSIVYKAYRVLNLIRRTIPAIIITSGKNFIKITSVGMGAAKSNETR